MSSPEARPSEAAAAAESTLEELRQRNAELAEAVAARDTFITVAAHELRNPMTPMMGQVDLVLKAVQTGRYDPGQIEQRLQRVRQAMQQYVRRATALLDVSRITSGKFSLEPVSCDLAELVREVVGGFADAARYAGAPIGVDVPASLPGVWDRLAVEQITDNLVSNAIKYGGSHPIHICVEDLDGHVRLRVRDRGPGISVHDRARIFGRFERAVGSSEQRSGFGVGLWVVGQLVEAMNGSITVEDAQGGGSVFNVLLPRHTKVG